MITASKTQEAGCNKKQQNYSFTGNSSSRLNEGICFVVLTVFSNGGLGKRVDELQLALKFHWKKSVASLLIIIYFHQYLQFVQLNVFSVEFARNKSYVVCH